MSLNIIIPIFMSKRQVKQTHIRTKLYLLTKIKGFVIIEVKKMEKAVHNLTPEMKKIILDNCKIKHTKQAKIEGKLI